MLNSPTNMEFTPLLSPSKARLQFVQAQEWAHVTTWLASKYHPSTPPPFERNEETLNALLALAALKESADEEREAYAKVEHDALKELDAIVSGEPNTKILAAMENSLTREGRTSLEALASLSVALGGVPTQREMANGIVQLKAAEISMHQQTQRVDALQESLGRELSSLQEQLAELRGDEFQSSVEVLQKTSGWTRSAKALSIKLTEYKDKLNSFDKGKAPAVDIPQMIEEEKGVLELQEKVKALEARVTAFQGLPPNWKQAKSEVERVKRALARLERQRDTMFEGLA